MTRPAQKGGQFRISANSDLYGHLAEVGITIPRVTCDRLEERTWAGMTSRKYTKKKFCREWEPADGEAKSTYVSLRD
jgi:hypothetical protein